MEQPRILRPRPRRPFEFAPPSTESSGPPTPAADDSLSDFLEAKDGLSPGRRTRSILNLTSSTLFGIYSPTAFETSRDDLSTACGTGAETPSLRAAVEDSRLPTFAEPAVLRQEGSHPPRKHGFRGFFFPLVLRSLLLFFFGVAYGTLITHLHDNPRLMPVKVENINHSSWQYMVFWGFAGVVLGSLLPWFDVIWEDALGRAGAEGIKQPQNNRVRITGDIDNGGQPSPRFASGLAADWNPAVRSIGAFVGIAFAIRKLPWQSTLQVSLTLALVNPVLWYLIDRSKPGFILSTFVGLAGMLALLGINPEVVPSPAMASPNASFSNESIPDRGTRTGVSQESVAVGTWIASVLFCSSVCFGNIGRRLAVGQSRK